jgi:hypothetical protein
LKWLEFRVGEDCGDPKPPAVVDAKDPFEGSSNSGDLPIGKIFDRAEMEPARGGDEERNFVHEHDVHGQDNLLVTLE